MMNKDTEVKEKKEIDLWCLFIKGEFYTANNERGKVRYMASVQKKYGVKGMKIIKCKLTYKL